ncbi:hypothetical protein SmJEL517_g02871 [Synchytrium microbalum]|uniref:GOLD domain-containing protein n=1 Tax=Synchytrium microbalum TaxID=1806994 RepID=A0A507CAN0_9FUNG|nr:uncharacterized protein SmJEL517_g02871 [Synchytrium microbalum]TPX34575.1 hypothetical protein SmJEL517_g02871 [Synchytrium microbalum]
MRTLIQCLLVLAIVSQCSSLYFYLEGGESKCFIEELPMQTVVLGHFKAEEWNDQHQRYMENPASGIQIFVEELPSRHEVMNQKAASSGKFAFTAAEAGDHSICFSSNTSSGWFSTSRIKLHLDLTIGDEDDAKTTKPKEVISDLARRVRELNHRIAAVRREQQYQREREAEFRDTSESTNSRVVNWAVAQLVILGLTCLWQVRHLKSFFIAKKLV